MEAWKREGDKKSRLALKNVIQLQLKKIDPTHHWHLVAIARRHAADYPPFGEAGRDCSCGCKWFLPLEGDTGRAD